jgi:hypothetical protein
MQARWKLRRNCAHVAAAGRRKVCVAKRPTAVHGRRATPKAIPPSRGTTLVLGASRPVFSTDAINHDLIALPICKNVQQETPNKKIKSKTRKSSEETPEQ